MNRNFVKFIKDQEVQLVSTRFEKLFEIKKNILLKNGFVILEDSEPNE
jgi:hypothetical protein